MPHGGTVGNVDDDYLTARKAATGVATWGSVGNDVADYLTARRAATGVATWEDSRQRGRRLLDGTVAVGAAILLFFSYTPQLRSIYPDKCTLNTQIFTELFITRGPCALLSVHSVYSVYSVCNKAQQHSKVKVINCLTKWIIVLARERALGR